METEFPVGLFFGVLAFATVVVLLFVIPRIFEGTVSINWNEMRAAAASWKCVVIFCTVTCCVAAVQCSLILRPAEYLPIAAHTDRGWAIYRVATHPVDNASRYEKVTDSTQAHAVGS
ncbi:MAG: hypothetical protein C0483_18405 [Pirellula sp.]|nr:hypothetical protein [Pirellula sp.]